LMAKQLLVHLKNKKDSIFKKEINNGL